MIILKTAKIIPRAAKTIPEVKTIILEVMKIISGVAMIISKVTTIAIKATNHVTKVRATLAVSAKQRAPTQAHALLILPKCSNLWIINADTSKSAHA
ncbi:MAG: hypothetical protein KME11_02810 [Timaviella obliquedivisa GSE-PSE-MK23-08B]|nr:hypothetical protein [Timaviella obliquedivisa GSE-PSE-MK23-08B]